jgi:hypothetical protein
MYITKYLWDKSVGLQCKRYVDCIIFLCTSFLLIKIRWILSRAESHCSYHSMCFYMFYRYAKLSAGILWGAGQACTQHISTERCRIRLLQKCMKKIQWIIYCYGLESEEIIICRNPVPYRADWCGDEDLYSGSTRFETWLCYQVLSLKFYVRDLTFSRRWEFRLCFSMEAVWYSWTLVA